MSAQPNRKQQRLAREASKSDGVPYQTALAKIRAGGQQPTQDADGVVDPHGRMLEFMYETFAATGKWPLFQYVSAHWDEANVEARDVYLDLAEQGLVRPAMIRRHEFQLREGTVVGVSLQGLMGIGSAAEDLDRFVAVVRYVAKSAREFRPSSPTELERLELRSEDVRQHLGLELGAPSLARLGALLSDEAWQLWTSFGRTESEEWSFEVNLERARLYGDIQTVIDFLEISYPEQYRQQESAAHVSTPDVHGDDLLPPTNGATDTVYLFISHASEDTDTIARPLAEALRRRGHSVWFDEFELTLGDGLRRSIDRGLADSRFGLVILSPDFFAKEWPQRELDGLTTRELAGPNKVILPVWHEVDHEYVARFSPPLADKLAVQSTAGIPVIVDQIERALAKADISTHAELSVSVAAPVKPDDGQARPLRLTIPSTSEQQARVVAERPEFWEYLLFAGALVKGKQELETKWDDHELRLPRGPRREFDLASANDFLRREIGWIQKHIVLDRIISPSIYQQAFGAPGQSGDPTKIEGMARRLLSVYESWLDWAAGLRNTSVPPVYEEVLETTACLIDGPVLSVREFIDHMAHQTARLPELAADGTDEHPITLTFELKLNIEGAVVDRNHRAWEKLRTELA
ncbi:MAG: toll/interleukin-1 receptor domain-containing protein [Solirubrobacteraceae bacterium]